MSAWVVEGGHIDVLVAALLEYEVISETDADATGRELWRENNRSVNFLYDENDRTPRYRRQPATAPLHPVAVLKAIGCYTYQSCEHPTWKTSRAYELMTRLQETILARNPDLARVVPGAGVAGRPAPAFNAHPVYGTAPWGFESVEQAYAEAYTKETGRR